MFFFTWESTHNLSNAYFLQVLNYSSLKTGALFYFVHLQQYTFGSGVEKRGSRAGGRSRCSRLLKELIQIFKNVQEKIVTVINFCYASEAWKGPSPG